jgi:hypothetical protein
VNIKYSINHTALANTGVTIMKSKHYLSHKRKHVYDISNTLSFGSAIATKSPDKYSSNYLHSRTDTLFIEKFYPTTEVRHLQVHVTKLF